MLRQNDDGSVTLVLDDEVIYGYQMQSVTIEVPESEKLVIEDKNGVIPRSWRIKDDRH